MDLTKQFNNNYQYLKKLFTFSKKCEPKKQNPFSKFEYYIYKFQSLVIWEHPLQTLSCLAIVHLLFWMVVNLCWKFYGIIFTMLLIFCTHDVWTERIWPEIRVVQPEMTPYQDNWISSNPRILSVNELNEYFNKLVIHLKMTLLKLRNLRSSYPLLFCSVCSFFFGFITVIGCTISGLWLLYVLIMATFLLPGFYLNLVPSTYKKSLKEYLNNFCKFLSSDAAVVDDEEDEYVPKMSKENFDTLNEIYASVFELDQTSKEGHSLTDDEALLPEIIAVPSYDDSSLDGCISFENSIKNQMDVSDSSLSSDVSENMKFQRGHFSHADDEFDTSSDNSEKAFIPNTSKSEIKDVQPDSLLSNIVAKLPDINQIGRQIMSNVLPTSCPQTQSQQMKRCNTDEEFEFVNESDLN